MNLHTVTFSGASNGTSLSKMCDISESRPYVEWGIQTPHFGGGLFPDSGWVKELVSTGLPLSAHMCYVRELLEDANPKEALDIEGWGFFDRIQINTHGSPHSTIDKTFELFQTELFEGKEIIFQVDDVPDNLDTLLKAHSMGINVSGLFDTSHGGGRSPSSWPIPQTYSTDAKFGYSGGLGPDNMSTALPKIANAAGDSDIWIDMEGKIRDYQSGGLDFDKIQHVLDSVEDSGFLKNWS